MDWSLLTQNTLYGVKIWIDWRKNLHQSAMPRQVGSCFITKTDSSGHGWKLFLVGVTGSWFFRSWMLRDSVPKVIWKTRWTLQIGGKGQLNVHVIARMKVFQKMLNFQMHFGTLLLSQRDNGTVEPIQHPWAALFTLGSICYPLGQQDLSQKYKKWTVIFAWNASGPGWWPFPSPLTLPWQFLCFLFVCLFFYWPPFDCRTSLMSAEHFWAEHSCRLNCNRCVHACSSAALHAGRDPACQQPLF